MEVRLLTKSAEAIKTPVLIMPFTKESLKKLRNKTKLEKLIKRVKDNKEFKAEKNTTLTLTGLELNAKKVILCGLGEEKELDLEVLRRALSGPIKSANAKETTISLFNVRLSAEDKIKAAAESIILSSYKFDKYISYSRDNPKIELKKVTITSENATKYKSTVKETQTICNNTNYVKELINEISEKTTTLSLAREARELASRHKSITVKVLDDKAIRKEGLNLLNAVGKGSRFPPRLVILTYKGNSKSRDKTAVVGKGITFDTGGLNLKSTSYIEDMRSDMSGAATVLGIVKAAAELKLKANVIGVMPLAENMISSLAYKPGDVFKGYSGKTVEVMNTDAEGRLILADALAYLIKNHKPSRIIDLATLTGAALGTFYQFYAALLSNNDKLSRQLQNSSKETGEKVWPLPLHEDYKDLMKSKIADLRNISTERYGGTITAAIFLQNFIGDTAWAHLDIAPTAFVKKPHFYNNAGATGFGLRLIIDYLKGE
jgi:leucyl aminopeptidase